MPWGPKRPIPLDERFVARFWAKVDRRGPDECWPWTGTCLPHGYGVMSAPHRGQAPYRAARVAFAIAYGDPGDAEVLHDCDNPPCCNARHLSRGTHRENMQAMGQRGRVNRKSMANLRPGAPGFHGAGPRSRREIEARA